MQRRWFRVVGLICVLSLLLIGNIPASLAQTKPQPVNQIEGAFQNALDAYNAAHQSNYAIAAWEQDGSVAYASAVSGDADADDSVLVLLGKQTGAGWDILTPGESPAAEYNQLLNAFSDSLIDPTTKIMLAQPEEPALSVQGLQLLANYTGYKLPWPYGKSGYVTQKDTTYHMSQIDFDIQGLAASGDIYAGKPGTVVFVKESSSTTCSKPAPDPCWKKSNMVVIQHPSGEYSWYVHMEYNSVPVSVGQNVSYGTKIGVEGKTGYSTGVHLHFMASSGHTTWTNPANADDAPWATGITPVDFDEYTWANLIQSYSVTYTSQNGSNLPPICPGAGGALLFRNAQYNCAGMPENSGYFLRTHPGFQNLPSGMNDQATSLQVPAGGSVLLYESTDRGGGKQCINDPGDDNLSDNIFDNGVAVNDRVSSLEYFLAPDCPIRATVDTTAPAGSLTNPASGAVVGRYVTLSANASDPGTNPSGVQTVGFSATWGGQTRVIATDRSAPYSYAWDLCAAGVPDGNIDITLRVLDNSANAVATPPVRFSKAFDCSSVPGGAWSVEYWANANLSGAAALHADEGGAMLFQDWGSAGPGGSIPADGWSARFTRSFDFPGGDYRFHCQSADGCRVLIDGQARITAWQDADFAGQDWSGTLSQGSHTIIVEYYDNQGEARLEVWWQGPGFLPSEAACTTEQWCVDFYGSPSLTGTPAAHINAGETLEQEWGTGAPDALLPADGFSSRAARSASFDCGTYRFSATTSDALQVWVDDTRQINQPVEPAQAQTYTVDVPLERGEHSIQVEQVDSSGDAGLSVSWERQSTCATALTLSGGATYHVRPGTVISPALRAQVTSGSLDPARGDTLTLVSGNLLGAVSPQPVRSYTATGESYIFDASNGFSMLVPSADGTYTSTWQVTAGGSPVGVTAAIQVVVDSSLPAVSISSPTGYLTSSPINITASASDSPAGIGQVQFFAGYLTGSTFTWHDLGYDFSSSGGWTKTWDPSGVQDQTQVKFFAQAWDKAGNTNGNWTNSLILDRTPPVTAVTGLAVKQESTRFLVQWSASDAVSGLEHVDIQYQLDGVWHDWKMNYKGTARSAWFDGLMGKSYTFRIRGADLASNLGSYATSSATLINPCSGDAFEEDDDYTQAKALITGSAVNTHNLCGTGDADWYAFHASAGVKYMFFTEKLAATTNTILGMYTLNGATLTLLKEDKDTTGPTSLLILQSPVDRVVYLKVRHAESIVAGNAVTYALRAEEAQSFFLPIIRK